MTNAAIAGWAGAVITLAGYAFSVVRHRPQWFHLANTIGVFGIAWSAIDSRAWPNLALTVAFGCIGAYGLYATFAKAR